MTRLTGRTTSTTRREIAAIVAEWERGQLNRRSLLRRAAMMGLGSAALATLVGREATGRASAAVLRAMQDDPAAGVRGGTLRVATIGEPPHLDEHQSTAEIIADHRLLRLRGALHLRRDVSGDPRAGGDAHRQRGRSDPHDGAAPGRHVPQRRRDESGRRDRLGRALGPHQRRRQASHGEDQRAGPGRRLHRSSSASASRTARS